MLLSQIKNSLSAVCSRFFDVVRWSHDESATGSGNEEDGNKKMGKKSVVVLSLAVWRKIEDYLEDLEMAQSRQLAAKIKRARSQKNCIRWRR